MKDTIEKMLCDIDYLESEINILLQKAKKEKGKNSIINVVVYSTQLKDLSLFKKWVNDIKIKMKGE